MHFEFRALLIGPNLSFPKLKKGLRVIDEISPRFSMQWTAEKFSIAFRGSEQGRVARTDPLGTDIFRVFFI